MESETRQHDCTVGALKRWLGHFEDDERLSLVGDPDGESAGINIGRQDPWGLWSFEESECDFPVTGGERDAET